MRSDEDLRAFVDGAPTFTRDSHSGNGATPPWEPAAEAAEKDNGGLFEWDAGGDDKPIPPRGWLLGSAFCRRFLSSLIAAGGTGKTAVRTAQALSMATGRSLTGEHVFRRSRVLFVSLEDDRDSCVAGSGR